MEYWKVCVDCKGQGKILRSPSRRRRNRYQQQVEACKLNDTLAFPEPLKEHKDICHSCTGSGLTPSTVQTPINPHYPTIAIIGAGIGGIAAAVACLHRGIPFTLYERDASFTDRSQGYGLTLQQASNALSGFGIQSLEEGIISTKHVVHTPDGTVIGEWGMRKWKVAQKETKKRKNVHIARQSLRQSLLNQLKGTQHIQWNHRYIDAGENQSGGMDVTFQVGEEQINKKVDLVIAADGIRSSVREQIIPYDITPLRYLNCTVILGICSLDSLKKAESDLLDSATVFQTVNGHERIYVMPYDSESVMWQLSIPLSEEDAQELSTQGASAMKAEALKRVSWHTPIPEIINATPESLITGYPVYDRGLLTQDMLKNASKITLIGDAAHPMSPFKGQGANQALLDALSLIRHISLACGADSSWRQKGIQKTVLNDFEEEMIQRTSPKVKASAEAVQLLHSQAVLREGDAPRGRGL